jgi:hypothetical protein
MIAWLVSAALAALLAGSARAELVVIGIIGDFGAAAEDPVGAASELAVANLVKSWNPDFILTLGDNNYPSGAYSTIDQNIGQFYHEFIHPYLGRYGAGAAANRFFPSLGNHDWQTTNGQPHHDYFTLPGNERYYSHRHGLVEIFALNSNADPDGTTPGSVQGRWLQAQLAASTAPWRLVYFHHPPYAASPGSGSAYMRWPFADWGASAVLAGHDHYYARIHTNGIVYFINGLGGDDIAPVGGGSSPAAARYSADYGAMRAQATESNLVFHFIARSGAIVDTFTIGGPLGLPAILSHPSSQLTVPGRAVSFRVQAIGANLRYQWLSNSVELPGATNASLVISNVQPAHAADYTVAVSSGAVTNVSQSARLTVVLHPLISAQPQSRTVRDSLPATFVVAAEGSGPLRCQWHFNGAALEGATNTSLTLTNVQLEHAGQYAAWLADDLGSIWSEPARLTVLARPLVTVHPVSASAAVGETVVLSAAAKGTLPMNFSWRRNGYVVTNIMLNQHTCFWAMAGVRLTNAGRYTVGITNLAGTAVFGLSSNAWVTVLEDLDGDRMPDEWETAHGLQPGDPADAELDEDGDGHTSAQEYLAGTDPRDAASCLRMTGAGLSPSKTWWLSFAAVAGRTYAIEAQDGLSAGGWIRVAEVPACTTNWFVEWINTDPGWLDGRRHYRVVTPRLP